MHRHADHGAPPPEAAYLVGCAKGLSNKISHLPDGDVLYHAREEPSDGAALLPALFCPSLPRTSIEKNDYSTVFSQISKVALQT